MARHGEEMAVNTRETQFEDTPRGWAQRWDFEFAAAKKELKKWQAQSEKIIKRYLDERDASEEALNRWNLFTSNVQTKSDMMYGSPPKVAVGRKFDDANDNMGRVAGTMLERLLNGDIQRDGDGFSLALKYALSDYLLPGLAMARNRYVVEFETVPGVDAMVDPVTGEEIAPAIPETERKRHEDVETVYGHWKDQLWSPSRTFDEVRWWAHLARMTRDKLVERFGQDIGAQVPLNTKKKAGRSDVDAQHQDPWDRADVWEIWDKEHRQVFWYVEGFGTVLDRKDDPYGLEGFWPFARPMFANLTTSRLVPRPDFVICQDLYDEIDEVSSRIGLIEKALKVSGLYDKNADGVKRLLSDSRQNQLIPIENWGMFAEKGGIKGAIDWLPIDEIVAVLDKLRDYRSELIGALYQISGMSDVMRGQQTENGTPGEAQIKAKFASIRMQALQDEFARFASDTQKIRAELIAKFFDVSTILERSNAQYTFDAQVAPQAAEFIKSNFARYRIEVKSEVISQADSAMMKAERTEWLSALSSFMQAAGPFGAQLPGAMPFMLEILKWTMDGLRGASTIEGVLNQAIAQAKQMIQQQAMQGPQAQPPNPKLLALQAKQQADAQKTQLETQSELLRMQAETQQLNQRKANDAQWNIREELAKQHIKAGLGATVAPFPSSGAPGGMP